MPPRRRRLSIKEMYADHKARVVVKDSTKFANKHRDQVVKSLQPQYGFAPEGPVAGLATHLRKLEHTLGYYMAADLEAAEVDGLGDGAMAALPATSRLPPSADQLIRGIFSVFGDEGSMSELDVADTLQLMGLVSTDLEAARIINRRMIPGKRGAGFITAPMFSRGVASLLSSPAEVCAVLKHMSVLLDGLDVKGQPTTALT